MVGMTDFLTPTLRGGIELADPNSRLAFWKQILPRKGVHYTAKDGSRQFINFDDQYLTDLAEKPGKDTIDFLLADGKNSHDVGPENWRGKVAEMKTIYGHENPDEDGLYAKIVFPNEKAAAAVLANPDLGVSARIRPNIHKSDGSVLSKGIIHVLGTLDPQIEGMKAWETADLSIVADGDIIDLSNEAYTESEADMAGKKPEGEKKALADFTEADIEAMTDEELESFMEEYVPEFDGSLVSSENEDEPEDDDESDEDEDEDEDEDTDENEDEDARKSELVGAGADMSKEMQNSIDLANSRAEAAERNSRAVVAELNLAKWEKTKADYLAAGVPAHALDLAAPVLSVGGEMVIDLSNAEGEDAELDMAKVVTGLLDTMKGFIDLSAAEGHSGVASLSDTDAYDEKILAEWKI